MSTGTAEAGTSAEIAEAVDVIRRAKRGERFISCDECDRIVYLNPQRVIDDVVNDALENIPIKTGDGWYRASVELNGKRYKCEGKDRDNLLESIRYCLINYS